MCSILLLFLILTVIFDFLHDFSCPYIVEAEIAPTPCTSEASLVFTPERDCITKQTSPVTNQAYSVNPSLKRPEIYRQDRQRNGYTLGKLSLALPSVLEVEQEISYEVPELPCPLEFGREAQYRTQSCAGYQLSVGMVWVGRRLGGESRRWSSRSPSRHHFEQDGTQSVQSPRQRAKGKGKKGKEGKASGKETVGDTTSPFQTPSATGFETWQALDSTGFMPATASVASPFQVTNADGGLQEMAQALRRAYPDITKTPDDVKALLEKADKEAGRLGLKNLQQAAKHLDKAKKHLKEVNDQRKAHRARWLQHVTEGVTMWERQLEEYRRHQATLTDLATRTQTEISTTSRTIQILGAAGTGSALPAIPVPEAPDTIDLEDTDQEEEQLRQKLQTILRSCAHSLGISPDVPPQHAEGLPDAAGKGDEKQEEKPPKRQRSLEPFGAPATPSS